MAYIGVGFLLGAPLGFLLRVKEYQSPIDLSMKGLRDKFSIFQQKPEQIDESTPTYNARTMADRINQNIPPPKNK